MDGDEKGARAKKSLKGQNWLLFFLLLYLCIFLFLQGFNGYRRGKELSNFLSTLFYFSAKDPTLLSVWMRLGTCHYFSAKSVLKLYITARIGMVRYSLRF